MHRNVFGKGEKPVERDDDKRARGSRDDSDDQGALPGEMDPDTVFKSGVIGNYEPKEPERVVDSPGTRMLVTTVISIVLIQAKWVDR
jgi:hypothetical protein